MIFIMGVSVLCFVPEVAGNEPQYSIDSFANMCVVGLGKASVWKVSCEFEKGILGAYGFGKDLWYDSSAWHVAVFKSFIIILLYEK